MYSNTKSKFWSVFVHMLHVNPHALLQGDENENETWIYLASIIIMTTLENILSPCEQSE